MQYTATQHNGNMNVTKVDNEEWFKMSEVSIAQFEKITKSSSYRGMWKQNSLLHTYTYICYETDDKHIRKWIELKELN